MTHTMERTVVTTYDVKNVGHRMDTVYFVYKDNQSDDLNTHTPSQRLVRLLDDLQIGACEMIVDLDDAMERQERLWWDNCNVDVDRDRAPMPAVFEVELDMLARQILKVTDRKVI